MSEPPPPAADLPVGSVIASDNVACIKGRDGRWYLSGETWSCVNGVADFWISTGATVLRIGAR